MNPQPPNHPYAQQGSGHYPHPQGGWQPMQGGPPPGNYPYPAPNGQQASGPPPEPAKKRRKWPWIVLGIVVLIVIGSAVGGSKTKTPATTAAAPGAAPAAAPAAEAAGHTVTYKVLGSGRGLVTYMKEGFQQEQVSGAKLPWSKDLTFKDDISAFSGLSLVVQHSSGGGDITCKILVDGKEVSSSTSSGAYAVVTCNGSQV
jgi:hypothetical protein